MSLCLTPLHVASTGSDPLWTLPALVGKNKGSLSFQDAFIQLAQKGTIWKLIDVILPTVWLSVAPFQILCFECCLVATCESKKARSMLSSNYLKMVERHAYESAAGPASRTEAASPAVADESASSWYAKDPDLERMIIMSEECKQKTMAKLLEYGGTGLSSWRAIMAKSIWKANKARLKWRAAPQREADNNNTDGRGEHSMERIIGYAKDGYTPFWMQKGAVPSWLPTDSWDTPSREDVTSAPEAELFLWLARIVDDIEADGKMFFHCWE